MILYQTYRVGLTDPEALIEITVVASYRRIRLVSILLQLKVIPFEFPVVPLNRGQLLKERICSS